MKTMGFQHSPNMGSGHPLLPIEPFGHALNSSASPVFQVRKLQKLSLALGAGFHSWPPLLCFFWLQKAATRKNGQVVAFASQAWRWRFEHLGFSKLPGEFWHNRSCVAQFGAGMDCSAFPAEYFPYVCKDGTFQHHRKKQLAPVPGGFSV